MSVGRASAPPSHGLLRRLRWRRVMVLLALLGAAFAAVWPRLRRSPVFVVEVVRLLDCPDSLRGPVAQRLQPLLGRTFFEVTREAPVLQAELGRHPEVAAVQVTCRPPHTVVVCLAERHPTLAVSAGRGRWLNVDDAGLVVRATARPEVDLPQVYGLRPAAATAGAVLGSSAMRGVVACVRTCQTVLGAPPRTVALDDGVGLRARTEDGDLVLLGQADDLPHKLQVYRMVRNRLGEPAAYIDVSAPAAPAWRPGR